MQTKKRYLLLFVCCAFLAYWYFGGYRLQSSQTIIKSNSSITTIRATPVNSEVKTATIKPFQLDDTLDDYLNTNDLIAQLVNHIAVNDDNYNVVNSTSRLESTRLYQTNEEHCRMETCFDYKRCQPDNFNVFVYPTDETVASKISPSYQKVLNVIRESRYYTTDPEAACLFVLSLDTLDRDRLSSDYVRNMDVRLQRLPHWNNGINHVVFNLYAGTWPEYTEHTLDFNTGRAILAKASMSDDHIRSDFDVSIPLFHKTHPERGGDAGYVAANTFPTSKNYLLAFKGKRYVYGIGSETRNSLYHLHNRNDVIMVTTCRHGKNWKSMKDDRCDEDNKEYDRYDYDVLMKNSTFCLVPRGRRLGSFRFLEALQAGCVPVLLSNSWALPFSQVVDWSQSVIWADERLVLQVPDIVRSLSDSMIIRYRQQTQVLWERYFSSIEKIVYATLEIIRERLPKQIKRDTLTWNSVPGALVTLPTYSDVLQRYPFDSLAYHRNQTSFTAVIYCRSGMHLTSTSHLYKLVNSVAKSRFTSKIVIVWSNDKTLPARNSWPPLALRGQRTLYVIGYRQQTSSNLGNSISQRFYPHAEIHTDAVLSLDEDSVLTTDEIDFAFVVWREFPDRIVGYPARSHYWDDSRNTWGYTSKWTNDYSIVLTGAAFYHRYYNVLYTHWLSPLLHKTVEQSQNCEDILMNFLVAHVTRRPPIKVTQRKHYKQHTVSTNDNGKVSPWNDPDHFIQRQTCLNTFAAVFGYMPLMRSNLRLDPILFKDPVANKRKKYKKLELVGN